MLLSVPRSTLRYEPKGLSEEDRKLCGRFDKLFLEAPCMGSRVLVAHLAREGIHVNRKRVQRLRRKMGLQTIYCKPRLSRGRLGAKRYPYLLRDLKVTRSNQVWCTDITYIPMRRGHMYLVAIMDWYSRKVLAWRLSNTLSEDFCLEAFREALRKSPEAPEIVNTDQGSQFTGEGWLAVVEGCGAKVSQDGKGRWMDNVFIERLWRSVKYECVYLWGHKDGRELESSLKEWLERYNERRVHQALDYATPSEVYRMSLKGKAA